MKKEFIYFIILSFSLLLVYNLMIYIGFFRYIEGMETKSGAGGLTYVDPNLSDDPVYISKLNAANISFLKSQIDDITGLKREILQMKDKVDANSYAVEKINNSMQNMAKDNIPDKSVTSGLADTGNTIPPGST